MKPLQTQATYPSMRAPGFAHGRTHSSSGLWAAGTRPRSTPPEEAVTVRGSEEDRETVPAPAPAITRRVPAAATSSREQYEAEVQIPQAPPAPFQLRRRTSGQWRAQVVAEWVKLRDDDPRRE